MADRERSSPDLREHEETFHGFVRGLTLFAAHTVVILLILAAVFL